MFNLFEKQPEIGIDISDYSIEVLQISKKREILAYDRIILKEGIIQNGNILQKEKLVEKLKKVLEGRRTDKIIFSLPESKVFVGNPETIPWNTKEVYTDNIGKLHVAVPQKTVDQYVEVFKMAGVDPVVFDVESLSLGRALLDNKTRRENTDTMIVDIGARTTGINIFNGNRILLLSVTVPLAGNHFTEAIIQYIKSKNIDIKEKDIFNEAERLKRKNGFNPHGEVLSILQAKSQKIITEIKNIIIYHEKQSGKKIEKIILAGGSSLVPKIDEYLSLNLGKKVELGNPLRQIKDSQLLDNSYPSVLFANVIGLALRSGSNISSGINLLQQFSNKKEDRSKKSHSFNILPVGKKKFVFIMFFIITLFFILAFIFHIYWPFTPQKETPGNELPPTKEIIESHTTFGEETQINPLEIKTPSSSSKSELPAEEKHFKEEDVLPKEKTVTITETPTGWLNVREGPGTEYSKITLVYPKETYTLVEEKNKWYKIKILVYMASEEVKEIQGWIFSQYVIKN